MELLRVILEALAAALALAGCGFYLLCLVSARDFLRSTRAAAARTPYTPPVSFLKPLKGADPGMYESFRSHCCLDYPNYELIFAVSDPADPAIAEVQRLQREFPQRAIRLVLCDKLLGPNVKVSNLVQMLPHACSRYLVVNDSDICVAPDYLRRVMASFTDPQVGMVTCMYRGVAGSTLSSRLEALGIGTEFAAGVLAARRLQGMRFGLGSTLAVSRDALDAIGGFEPLLDYLADDYELGARIAAAGRRVELSDAVVEHHLPDYTFAAFVDHQLRWNRSTRDSRPLGYAGLVMTFGLPWALVALMISAGAPWAWLLLAAAVVLRAAMALTVGWRVLRDREVPRRLWLLPVRDILALLLWASSFLGHQIAWRGERFVLKNGKLRPA